jgi:hypothetical protein
MGVLVLHRRVDFFIIGVQKGGTTALASYLAGHPEIGFSRVKEVHHFDDETRVDWAAPDHARLHAQFDWDGPDRVRGEATPITIYWPPALPRLKAYNDEARLILALRHPSLRAWSHWRMETGRKADTFSFEEAISPEGRARVAEAPGGVHRAYSYVERGLYAAQIARLLKMFPRQQIHFLRTDDLWHDTGRTLAGIERFLGVSPAVSARAPQRYIVPLAPVGAPGMTDPVRASLDALYAEDIRQTAALAGLDLSDWLAPGYAEPMQPG